MKNNYTSTPEGKIKDPHTQNELIRIKQGCSDLEHKI